MNDTTTAHPVGVQVEVKSGVMRGFVGKVTSDLSSDGFQNVTAADGQTYSIVARWMEPMGQSALTLSKMRNGDKRGTFMHHGHEVTVVVQASDAGRYNHVRACSDTHPGLTPVLADAGLLIKRGVGRYELRSKGATSGYDDRGTVASLAERMARYLADAA